MNELLGWYGYDRVAEGATRAGVGGGEGSSRPAPPSSPPASASPCSASDGHEQHESRDTASGRADDVTAEQGWLTFVIVFVCTILFAVNTIRTSFIYTFTFYCLYLQLIAILRCLFTLSVEFKEFDSNLVKRGILDKKQLFVNVAERSGEASSVVYEGSYIVSHRSVHK